MNDIPDPLDDAYLQWLVNDEQIRDDATTEDVQSMAAELLTLRNAIRCRAPSPPTDKHDDQRVLAQVRYEVAGWYFLPKSPLSGVVRELVASFLAVLAKHETRLVPPLLTHGPAGAPVGEANKPVRTGFEGDYNGDGTLTCNLCWTDPCKCGKPTAPPPPADEPVRRDWVEKVELMDCGLADIDDRLRAEPIGALTFDDTVKLAVHRLTIATRWLLGQMSATVAAQGATALTTKPASDARARKIEHAMLDATQAFILPMANETVDQARVRLLTDVVRLLADAAIREGGGGQP